MRLFKIREEGWSEVHWCVAANSREEVETAFPPANGWVIIEVKVWSLADAVKEGRDRFKKGMVP